MRCGGEVRRSSGVTTYRAVQLKARPKVFGVSWCLCLFIWCLGFRRPCGRLSTCERKIGAAFESQPMAGCRSLAMFWICVLACLGDAVKEGNFLQYQTHFLMH